MERFLTFESHPASGRAVDFLIFFLHIISEPSQVLTHKFSKRTVSKKWLQVPDTECTACAESWNLSYRRGLNAGYECRYSKYQGMLISFTDRSVHN